MSKIESLVITNCVLVKKSMINIAVIYFEFRQKSCLCGNFSRLHEIRVKKKFYIFLYASKIPVNA